MKGDGERGRVPNDSTEAHVRRTRSIFAPSDLLPSSSGARVGPGPSAQSQSPIGVVRTRHPDIDDVARATTMVGNVLLKHEERDLAAIDTFSIEIERAESEPFDSKTEPPCSLQASDVERCYVANQGRDVSSCREFVDAYKTCSRESLSSFVKTSSTR
jgi:hypothetical protein